MRTVKKNVARALKNAGRDALLRDPEICLEIP
jgi:hypothetical protein